MVTLQIDQLRNFVAEEVASQDTAAIDLERFKRQAELYLQDMQRALQVDLGNVNPGYVPPIVVASATVDLPSIGSKNSAFIDVATATPTPLGTHILSWAALTDATTIDDLLIQILVVAADTVRITMQNPTAGAIDPDPITFQFITATATDT